VPESAALRISCPSLDLLHDSQAPAQASTGSETRKPEDPPTVTATEPKADDAGKLSHMKDVAKKQQAMQ